MDTQQFYEHLCQEEKKLNEALSAIRILKKQYATSSSIKAINQPQLPLEEIKLHNVKRVSMPEFICNYIREQNKNNIDPTTDDIVGAAAVFKGISKKDIRANIYTQITSLKKKEYILTYDNPNGAGSIFKINHSNSYIKDVETK